MIVLSKIISVCRTLYYVLHPGGIIFHFSKRRPFSEYSAIKDIIFIRQKIKKYVELTLRDEYFVTVGTSSVSITVSAISAVTLLLT